MTPARYNYIKHLVLELPHVTMQKPTIHLNGTSAQSLAEQYADARYSCEQALEALHRAAPHGRDYYPQGEAAITQAVCEHSNRADKLAEIIRDLQALELHCANYIK